MPARLVRIIYNPISGRGHDPGFIDTLAEHLRIRRFDVEPCPTRHAGHATELAAGTPDDAHAVVSIGGDGTHRDVAAGLAGRPVPMAAIAAGTENVLVKTFGLARSLPQAVDLVQRGRPMPIDVALCGDQPFLMFSGVGFDAAITREVHRNRTGPIIRAAYFGPIVKLWFRYRWPPLRVHVDGKPLCDEAGMVFVGNTRLYADGLRVLARAAPDDGLLDVCCFRTRSRVRILAQFGRAKLGVHLRSRGVVYGQGRRIEVSSPEGAVPVQIDGDAVTDTPAVYTIRPRALRLLLPPRSP